MDESQIPGKWQMTTSENFDAFMAALGVSYVTRKVGNATKPLVTIEKTGPGAYLMKQESMVKTTQLNFEVGKHFDETTADGRKVQSLMTLDKPNSLTHLMKGTDGGKDSVCWREFDAEKMKCVCKVDDIVTTRWYERVKAK